MSDTSLCPFCKIERSLLVKNGKFVYVQLSNPRLVDGHMLVIPKRHVEYLHELNEEERKELFDVIIEIQQKVLDRFSSGCDIRQNCRPFLPEGRLKVNHVHIHIIPREKDDELHQKSMKFQDELFRELTEEERVKFIKLFGL